MSLKQNFIYNSILTISGYLFPLLTYPYVSRVLGVSNIGICNFVDSIVNYFILFSMMGIGAVGMREISQHRDDIGEMSRHFTGLFLLNLISTFIAILALLISMYTIEALFLYRDLLYIGVCKLFFNIFLIEWFYAGVEDFKYITNRSIFVRTIYVILIFLFIKNASDYKLYYFLTVSTYIINGAINIIYCRKYIKYSTLKGIRIQPYIKPFFTIGLYILITNIYTSLNIIWLGFVSEVEEVGYYTTATKIHAIILAFFTAMTNVIFPRVSYLYAKGEKEEFWEKIKNVVEIVFIIAIPLVILISIFSPNIIHLISGDGYEGAYTPLRIIALLILILGYSQVLVTQILMTIKQDKKLLFNSCLGACIGLLLNILLVHRFGALGAALVWLLSEITISIGAQFWVTKFTSFHFPWKLFSKYIIAYIPLTIILLAIFLYCNYADFLILCIATSVTALYSLIIQMAFLKNSICMHYINKFISYAK